MNYDVIIIGAGPAGLATAYYFLVNTDLKPIILEESPYVAGSASGSGLQLNFRLSSPDG